jgi:hypothetical protein
MLLMRHRMGSRDTKHDEAAQGALALYAAACCGPGMKIRADLLQE